MRNALIVIVFALLLSGCNRLDAHQPLTDTTIPLTLESSVSQTFLSSRDGLNIVSICIRNPKRALTPMQFKLYESTSNEVIREIQFSGGNIDNLDCTRFQFEPILTSRDRIYRAEVSALEGGDPPLGMHIEAYSVDDYLEGHTLIGDDTADYDLHFKTNYKQDRSGVISESVDKFVDRILIDNGFMSIYLIIIIFIIYHILRKQ